VLHDQAAPALLDTYHDERQPVGRTITEQALANSISMGRTSRRPHGVTARPEFLNEQGMIFGASYASSAVIPDGTPPVSTANPVTDYVPSGRPGGRAPHVALVRDGARASTIDLVGRRFALFTGRSGRAWRDAAQRAAEARRLPLDIVTIGDGGDYADADGTFPAVYGIDDSGAVLVRPDGYVAWRARAANDATGFASALTHVLGR
jgi:hypothetical protein